METADQTDQRSASDQDKEQATVTDQATPEAGRDQPNAAHFAAEEINLILAGMPTVAALAVLHGATAEKLRELGAQAVPAVPSRPAVQLQRGWMRSRIERDPDVKAALWELSGTMTIDEVRAHLLNRFEPSRVPSRSSIHYYLRRHRKALGHK